MKQKLWPIRHVQVPNGDQPIRIVDGLWVLVVRRCAKFRKLHTCTNQLEFES